MSKLLSGLTDEDYSQMVAELLQFTQDKVHGAGGTILDGAAILLRLACMLQATDWTHHQWGTKEEATAVMVEATQEAYGHVYDEMAQMIASANLACATPAGHA
jgi:hypothetical protein